MRYVRMYTSASGPRPGTQGAAPCRDVEVASGVGTSVQEHRTNLQYEDAEHEVVAIRGQHIFTGLEEGRRRTTLKGGCLIPFVAGLCC